MVCLLGFLIRLPPLSPSIDLWDSKLGILSPNDISILFAIYFVSLHTQSFPSKAENRQRSFGKRPTKPSLGAASLANDEEIKKDLCCFSLTAQEKVVRIHRR